MNLLLREMPETDVCRDYKQGELIMSLSHHKTNERLSIIAAKQKKANGLDFELTTISPQLARQWLDANTRNRSIS